MTQGPAPWNDPGASDSARFAPPGNQRQRHPREGGAYSASPQGATPQVVASQGLPHQSTSQVHPGHADKHASQPQAAYGPAGHPGPLRTPAWPSALLLTATVVTLVGVFLPVLSYSGRDSSWFNPVADQSQGRTGMILAIVSGTALVLVLLGLMTRRRPVVVVAGIVAAMAGAFVAYTGITRILRYIDIGLGDSVGVGLYVLGGGGIAMVVLSVLAIAVRK